MEEKNIIGMIADHPTPKIKTGGAMYTLNSRDYKGVPVVATYLENAVEAVEPLVMATGQANAEIMRGGAQH